MRPKLSDRVAIMTPRPGRVAEIKTVEFARPRDLTDPAMVGLAADVKRWLRRQAFARNTNVIDAEAQFDTNHL